MIAQFAWREGSHVSRSLDPQACGAFLQSLIDKSPQAIVTASRPVSAPTHGHFSWDLSPQEAVARVLENEARYLVRSIVVIDTARPDVAPVPAFVSIVPRDSDDRSYLGTYEALEDVEYRLQVLAEAKSAMVAWRRRYRDLTELSRVFEAIDQLVLPVAEAA